MVQPHLVRHLKKHYGVETMSDLTFGQGAKFGSHLQDMIEGKEENNNEDYEPYSLSQEVIDWGNETNIEGWDFGTWFTTHVVQAIPPNMPVKGKIEDAVKQFLTKLDDGEELEAMSAAFDTKLKEILSE